MANLVLFGIGQLAETVSVYIERESDHQIVGYTLDADFRAGRTSFRGKPVYDWETLEDAFAPSDGLLFGPISYRNLNQFRKDRFLNGKARGYRFLTFIHPASHVHSDDIGENCLVLEQNVLQPFSTIGDNVILWSNNHIGHHTTIGSHCFITSQVGIAGSCKIGESCFFAGKSGVIDNLTVGDGCLLGPATTITTDLAEGAFALSAAPRIVEGGARRFAKTILG